MVYTKITNHALHKVHYAAIACTHDAHDVVQHTRTRKVLQRVQQ